MEINAHQDQTEGSRHLSDNDTKQVQEETDNKSDEEQKIDILNLPSRKEVHSQKEFTHIKLTKPFMRLVSVFVVVLAVIGGTLFVW